VTDKRLPLWQAGLWVLVGGFAAQLAGGFVSATLRAILQARGASAEQLESSALVIVPAIVVQGCTLIGLAIAVPALAGLPIAHTLGVRRAPPSCYAAAALGTVMLGPAGDVLMRVMQALAPKLTFGVVPMLHDLVRGLPLIVAFPALALLPGISEELMFRGLLQNAARRGAVAISVSAFGFALFHIDPHHVVGVLPLGFFLAWVATRCGTLVTIFAHVSNNSAAIAAVHSQTFDVGYGTEQPMPWQWLPVSLLLVAAATALIARATAAAAPQAGSVTGAGPAA
jgi:membrane protease YdiL (CAAX protease family)